MGAPYRDVALWRWDRGEPVPDARLVVCAPGVGWVVEANRAQVVDHHERGGHLVVSGGAFNGAAPPGVIPALHVRTKADLARLSDLLAVKAERRALVLSPTEPIALLAPLHLWGGLHEGGRTIDLVIVCGFDEPLHPEHARALVAQCRAADVPCVFAGWGRYIPDSQLTAHQWDLKHAALRTQFHGDADAVREEGGEIFYRFGTAASGALLDGQPVAGLPDWVSA